MGPEGLKQVAEQSMAKAHYLAEQMLSVPGIKLVYKGAYFHEFVVSSTVDIENILLALDKHGMLGGYPLRGELDRALLWCATEANSKEEIDRVVEILKEVCSDELGICVRQIWQAFIFIAKMRCTSC